MKKIIEFLIGIKYYANICNDMNSDFIASTPFKTKEAAAKHRESLHGNLSVQFVKTISFRTKEPLE